MEQVNLVLGKLWEHRFWVLSFLVLLLAPLGWVFATGSLSKSYADSKAKIEQSFSQVSGLSGNASELWFPEMDKEIKALRESVYEAHKANYDRQQKDLTWPEYPDVSQEFVKEISELKPGKELTESARESYRDYIAKEIPKLAALLDARPTDQITAGGAGGYPGASGAVAATTTKLKGKVVWQESDQLTLKAAIAPWEGGDGTNAQTPTTADILLTQEDVWVYRKVFLTIAAINQKAAARFEAPIKTVNQVELGSAATTFLTTVQGSEVEMGVNPAASSDPYASYKASAPDPAAGAAYSKKRDRYLSQNKQPLSDPEEADKLPLKLIPVHMGLVVDQREIPTILAACGNASIEILSLRVTCKDATQGSSGGGAGGGYPGGKPGGGGGYPGGGYPGGAKGYPGRAQWERDSALDDSIHFVGPWSPHKQLAQGYPGPKGGYPGGGGGYPGGGKGGYPGSSGGGGGGSAGAALLDGDPELGPADVYVDLVGAVYFYNKPIAPDEQEAAEAQSAGEEDSATADEGQSIDEARVDKPELVPVG